MNGRYHQQQAQPKKDMYIISLDLTRVFWIIAISLFFLTFFFLFGYWLGSDSNYLDTQKDRLTHKSNEKRWLSVNKDELRKAYEEEKAKVLARKSFNKDKLPYYLREENAESLPQKRNSFQDRAEAFNRNSQYDQGQKHPNDRKREQEYTRQSSDSKKDNRTMDKRTRPVELRRFVRPPSDNQNRVGLSARDRKLSKRKPYTIQVSTHRVKSNAYRLQRKLKRQYPAYVFAKSGARGKVSYFVRVGPYSTEDMAHKMQIKLLQVKEAKNSIVVNR